MEKTLKQTIGRFVQRRIFTTFSAVIGLTLCAVICYAIYDFVTSAKQKDEATQRAVLNGELARFLLAVRTEDGGTLFDNATQFAKATRPLGVLTLTKPFYGYFLNKGNAKTVQANTIQWTAPRSCVTQFAAQGPMRGGTSFGLQTCFAAIQNDQAGRYIYFSLRYPTPGIVRHLRGMDPRTSDHVALRIQGNRTLDVRLAYMAPPLAQARYPSQLKRFEGIHEVTAYLANGQPLRSLNAQAYERIEPEDPLKLSYVTVLGRINSAAVVALQDHDESWPGPQLQALNISLELVQGSQGSRKEPAFFSLPVGKPGNALISIEQAYVSHVISKSLMEASARAPMGKTVAWTSASLDAAEQKRQVGRVQQWSDIWSEKLFHFLGYDKTPQIATDQSLLGSAGISATLTTESPRLSDLATRVFLWLSLALLLMIVLAGIWMVAVYRLQRIANTAYNMTARPSSNANLAPYARYKDEIGRLARIFDLSIRKSRAKDRQIYYRKSIEVRYAEEQIKTRHAILEAIGHEIRSPLQSLLNRTAQETEFHSDLERMRRAVEALHLASSVESGLQSGLIVLERADASQYLSNYADNLTEQGRNVVYRGQSDGIFATFDPINFEQVLEHVVDNAVRHRVADTSIEISLLKEKDSVVIEVFNQGEHINDADLEKIFEYRRSSSDRVENIGLGLLVARIYMAGMQGSIRAENRPGGVAVVMKLPQASWSER